MTYYLNQQKFITPLPFILITFLASLFFQGYAISLLTKQPWTGIKTQKDLASGHIRIISITPGSPADQKPDLYKNQVITAIKSTSEYIILRSADRNEYLAATTYHELDEIIRHQSKIWKAITENKNFTLITLDNKNITLTSHLNTPIHAIPNHIWWLLPIHLLLPIIGAFVWFYQPTRIESILIYVAGLNYSLFGGLFYVIYRQDFAINPDLILPLATMGNAGMFLLGITLCAILTYYPNQLASQKLLLLYAGIWLFISLNYYYRWIELPLHIFFFQLLWVQLTLIFLIYRQWKAAQQNPINRATLITLNISTLLPTSLVILLYTIPEMLKIEPIINQLIAHLLLISIFGGWVLGILRFRLFDLEYWYFKSLIWILGGCLVILIDILLIGILNLSTTHALGLALVIAGFIYFPVRQWIIEKLMPASQQPLLKILPEFSASIGTALSSIEFEQNWKEILQQRFNPLHMATISEQNHLPTTTQLHENGLHLLTPTLQGSSLSYSPLSRPKSQEIKITAG